MRFKPPPNTILELAGGAATPKWFHVLVIPQTNDFEDQYVRTKLKMVGSDPQDIRLPIHPMHAIHRLMVADKGLTTVDIGETAFVSVELTTELKDFPVRLTRADPSDYPLL